MRTASLPSALPDDKLDAKQAEAEALAEELQALAVQLDTSDCILLMQQEARHDEFTDLFKQALQQAGIEPVFINLRKLPETIQLCLIQLDLSRAAHAYLSQLAARMACEDMQPKPLRAGRVQRMCAWILGSRVSSQRLTSHIAAHTLRWHSSRHKTRWVRFYDPMTVDCYDTLCLPEQRAWWLKDMEAWVYRNRWGQLASLVPPDIVVPVGLPPLSEEMWQRLDTVGALNQAWIKARLRGIEIDPARFRGALRALNQALSMGVSQRDDLDLFAWHALQWGEDFHRHPLVDGLLKRMDLQSGYCLLAQELDEAQWQQVMSSPSALLPSN